MGKKINAGKYTPKSKPDLPSLIRLFDKVEQNDCGCWLWKAHCDKHGYGQVRYNGRTQWSHRVFYSIFKRSIPEGYEVDHKCKERSCCNPDHLRAVPMPTNRRLIVRRAADENQTMPPF